MADATGDFNKHSMVSLGTDYIVFGNGRHAWLVFIRKLSFSFHNLWFIDFLSPGRFFAVNEIKSFMVHLLMNYDIMLDPTAPPFKNLMLSAFALPDPSACIMVRQRKAT